MTIWKFELEVVPKQTIKIPQGARILSVANQSDKPVMWAVVDPQNTKQDLNVYLLVTGGAAPSNLDQLAFRGTVLLREGSFVCHIFT